MILDKVTIDGNEWVLTKVTEVKPYFKSNGRGALKAVTTYGVWATESLQGNSFSSKAEATKYFKSLTNKAVVVERTGAAALNRIFG